MTTDTPAFHIGRAQSTDAPRLSELLASTFLAAYGHCSTPVNVQAFIADNYRPERQASEIESADIINFIASAGSDLAGVAQLRLCTPVPADVDGRALELGRFYLDSRFHGRGIAQALMQAVKNAAREHRAERLWLSVWKQSPQAIRFYEKEGFRIVGSTIFTVGDDPKEDWLMACDLISQGNEENRANTPTQQTG